jgi:hypothetical protein
MTRVGQPWEVARALGPPAPRQSALRRCGRRGGTRSCGMGRLAGRIVIAATSTRDAQTERPECIFDAKAHCGVHTICLWVNLPPLTLFAHPPVGCSHDDNPLLAQDASTREERQGQDACDRVRVPQAQQALPPHLDFYLTTILSNIHTAAVASPAPIVMGRVSSWQRGGRAAARRGEPAQPRPGSQ